MTWSNIKSVGKISTSSSIQGIEGNVHMNSFLDSFVKEFAIQSSKYIRIAKEAPFSYSERQLQSTICAGLARYTDAFLTELPVNRKWSGIKKKNYEDSHGWIDYWCSYKGIDIILELKHSFDSLRTNIIRKDTIIEWSGANSQLDVIKTEVKSCILSPESYFLIAMLVIPFYETLTSEQLEESYDYRESLLTRQSIFVSNLSITPNWSSVWMLNDNLAKGCIEKNGNSYIYYPGVLFLSKALQLIKK
jgi:hypothetical protein